METLPATWYSDPGVLRLEEERILRRSWQYAGRADQVAEPGRYFTCTAGDVPLVVTCDREGELRALVNVCRHRGHVVVEGEGRRETLQCPYHAWTYDLDGTLRKAPRSEREPGFEPDGLGLLPAQVGRWGPFVFVNADRGAPPLEEALGRLPELLAAGGVDVDALRFHQRQPWELRANWKIACENFLECYHCAVAHPSFSAQIDVSPDDYVLEEHATFWSQFAHVRAGGKPTYDQAGEVARGQFHLVWPNLKVNVYPGRPNLSIGPILPVEPERSAGFLDYFFAEDADPGWVADLFALDDQVGVEDRALVESVQRGVRSGAVAHGRLLLSSEHLIAGFQRRVAEALAS